LKAIDKTDSRSATNTYPLSISQQRIWIGQQLHPESPLYNMALRFDLKGDIDTGKFSRAFNNLINQVPALRSTFMLTATGEPVQRIKETLSFDLPVLDYTKSSETDLAQHLDEITRKPFKLAEQVFNSALFRLDKNHYVWYLNVHHLAIDIASFQSIVELLANLYFKNKGSWEITDIDAGNAFLENRAADNNPLATTYWEQESTKIIPVKSLYGKPLAQQGTEAIRVDLQFSNQAQLNEFLEAKPFRSLTPIIAQVNFLTSILFTYLRKLIPHDQVSINTIANQRQSATGHSQIGMFIELLPLSVTVDREETFISLFQKVNKQYLSLLKYRYPGCSRDIAGEKNIPAVLNFIPLQFSDFGSISSQVKWLHPGHIDSNHAFRLQATDLNGTGLSLALDINKSLFSDLQLANIPIHFMRVIQQVLSKPEIRISEISLVDQSEYDVVNQTLNPEILKPNSNTLWNLLATERGTGVAIQDTISDQELSYAELSALTNQLANLLRVHQVKPRDRIILFMSRSLEYVAALIAVIRSGAVFIPVPSDVPHNRLRYLIEQTNSKLVLTDTSTHAAASDIGTTCLEINLKSKIIHEQSSQNQAAEINPADLAYILFTSGSTGNPKGVAISHASISNYILSARDKYTSGEPVCAPLFTATGFDLTLTSLFLPLITGGKLIIYPEKLQGPDMTVLDVFKDEQINFLKLTPSHAKLIVETEPLKTGLKTIVFGGENLETSLANRVKILYKQPVAIYNEYGPTEATVGCIVSAYTESLPAGQNVPIGFPFAGNRAYILNEQLHPVPVGCTGTLYLGGPGLANGYYNNPEATRKSFINSSLDPEGIIYRTGDLVRLNDRFELEYLGREDRQFKLGGIRFESGEIESALLSHPDVEDALVDLIDLQEDLFEKPEFHCKQCGIPSNYPNISFNENGICNLCTSFENYKKNVADYFGDLTMLKYRIEKAAAGKTGKYDCIMLLSGGKDSTYALSQLVDLGFKVMAYTLDNGYISEEAKENIRQVTSELGVDQEFGTTQAMNKIFVDSLKRHSNVCNGCFKTLYTLSTQRAIELGIPVIVTGLSRGQFFETRLTEELFTSQAFKSENIDDTILSARKAYHRMPDAVSEYLDVSIFKDDKIFEEITYIDFYRYCDIELDDMLEFLDKRLKWKRPVDTGRSTNCLINDLGIYMHKKKRGYHNYSFPYSWDVRIGHKTREEALEELNDQIDEIKAHKMLEEIGYPPEENSFSSKQLVAYVKTSANVNRSVLTAYLQKWISNNLIPTTFVKVNEFPLSTNGKVDLAKLRSNFQHQSEISRTYIPPKNDIEKLLHGIWTEVFKLEKISTDHSFIELGGNSLVAIRMHSRIQEQLALDLGITAIFEHDTITKLANHIADTIKSLMEA